ncbi:uncharacterized protein [Henckelia pumila]|uniref:uncharacterized protein n=1 Tax=Henckelia pumila TaxID=405737 RepID=UPI003C6DD7D0
MQKGGSPEYLNHLHEDPPPPPPRQIPGFQSAENQQQPPPSQKCPRCDSSNTKFCYYNNYSLSQPRYFCKACRRYWTHGGTLRNVPVGGGCRKSKRPKASSSSSSSSPNREMARSGIQSLSPPRPSSNLITTGMISSHSLMRTSPPVNIQPFGNISFYTTSTGGAVLPASLAAMQTLPIGVNQAMAPLSFGGGSGGGNMALIHGMNLQSMKHAAPQQIQAPNLLFPSQQSLIMQSRPMSSWTQASINRGFAAPSATSSGFWSGGPAGGNPANGRDQAGSSSYPNQWSDSHMHHPAAYDPSNQ